MSGLQVLPSSLNLTRDEQDELLRSVVNFLGHQRRDKFAFPLLVTLYSFIFATGLTGNFCTCFIIWKNTDMHTPTNFYLFSLAVSDLLLISLGLSVEMYNIYESWPWIFGEAFCVFRTVVLEIVTSASILTVLCFTVERYLAICFPMISQKVLGGLRRALKMILIVWFLSFLLAVPYTFTAGVFVSVPAEIRNQTVQILDSRICAIRPEYWEPMLYYMAVTTFLVFVIPIFVITVLYILMGITLYKASRRPSHKQNQITGENWRDKNISMLKSRPRNSRRAVLKMLGILYYLSATVNPVLYNIMSKRYRNGFKRTLCRWPIATQSTSYRHVRANTLHNKSYDHHNGTGKHNNNYRTFHQMKLLQQPHHNRLSRQTSNSLLKQHSPPIFYSSSQTNKTALITQQNMQNGTMSTTPASPPIYHHPYPETNNQSVQQRTSLRDTLFTFSMSKYKFVIGARTLKSHDFSPTYILPPKKAQKTRRPMSLKNRRCKSEKFRSYHYRFSIEPHQISHLRKFSMNAAAAAADRSNPLSSSINRYPKQIPQILLTTTPTTPLNSLASHNGSIPLDNLAKIPTITPHFGIPKQCDGEHLS
ncbi:unnamed protein product [Didymodactylos carnosus]|uniref:G-protein coupled receptors family 1 profile domain-containing protein n=1 Tax=Didymodactylos carnosus TaxID=1234261 RepID=A0A8S2CQC3_9BILA|nr:unnamed protein product [Didymodactylos carnosus]CAF3531654.1 unnamed protein product [Didymodactylos carnosus]